MSDKKGRKMLISFINPVAVIVGESAITSHVAFVEEIFQGAVEVTPKVKSAPIPRMGLDFPLFLNVLALGDGRLLKQPQSMIVKYNNIASIVESDFEQILVTE